MGVLNDVWNFINSSVKEYAYKMEADADKLSHYSDEQLLSEVNDTSSKKRIAAAMQYKRRYNED